MTATDTPLKVDALAELLQPLLGEVISRSRSLAPLATTLATLSRSRQQRALHWIEVIARTNAELAYQFAGCAPLAFGKMSPQELDAWVLGAMHTYDHQGLYAAITTLQQIDLFLQHRHMQRQNVSLDSVQGILESFIQGLNGRRMSVEAGDALWTDTETMYLPRNISFYQSRSKNFQLYKSMVGLLWAQTWFGTFTLNDERNLTVLALTEYDDFDQAKEIFLRLETERLLARIERELPGLGRQMRELGGKQSLNRSWQKAFADMQAENATVDQCLEAVAQLYPGDPPQALNFQPQIYLPVTEKTIQARIDHEREQLQQALNRLVPAETGQGQRRDHEPGEYDADTAELQLKMLNRPEGNEPGFELSFNGQAIAPSPEVQELLRSILQDLGEIPLDYLVAGGSADPGQPQPSRAEIPESDEEITIGLPYPEWDYRRAHYRQDWCYLRELEVDAGPADFVDDTLQKYSAVLPQLRKSFEALRGEDKWLRRQLNGDEIDFDALVEALADMHHGDELGDRLYTRLSRIDRNIAVMLMIDMSGSTKGWVNDAEREALVLLCQALEILGDQYAIYGFSGMTRKRCELYRVKQFDEPYSTSIERRIGGISAKDYTRMGVTIRHLNKMLEAVPARTKLLITLSDGKPEDFDGYGGDYGIEDTRQALIESRRLGIHPFCITIDTEASSYLPHMYGAHSYAVVDDVRTLPLRVADVYRRLTH